MNFSIEHAVLITHVQRVASLPSEIRDLTADLTDNLLTEVCSDVCIELDLQPIDG